MNSYMVFTTGSSNAFVYIELSATLLDDLVQFLQVGPEQFLVSQFVTDLSQHGYQSRLERCKIGNLLRYAAEPLLQLLLHHAKQPFR